VLGVGQGEDERLAGDVEVDLPPVATAVVVDHVGRWCGLLVVEGEGG
jgi:hypothetical protein